MSTTQAEEMGHCTLWPETEVVCGSYGTWTATYVVGRHGMDNGAGLCLSKGGNWGKLQADTPAGADYVTARTSGPAKLAVGNEAHFTPAGAGLTVRVRDGSLNCGDTITLVLGDTSAGGPGHLAPTWVQDRVDLVVHVDPYGKGTFALLPDTPCFRLIAGPAARLRVIAPSQAVVDQPVEVLVRAEDRWCNTASRHTGRVQLWATTEGDRLPLANGYGFRDADRGLHRIAISLPRTGVCQIEAIDEDSGMSTLSNPVVCHGEALPLQLLWGDIHGQTGETGGTGTMEGYFSYGRSAAALDFCAHTGNDHSLASADYEMLKRRVREAHDPAEFVTFLGYEWSGNTPNGGDHNVYYLGDDGPIHRSSHWQLEDQGDGHDDRLTVQHLCDTYRGRKDVLIVPHIGGRRANLDFYDADLMPVIEVCSCHGIFEWFIEEAMERGLCVGFIGGTDDHSCRPGLTAPQRPTLSLPGGLCAVYAQDASRAAIWAALKARRCYATTGQRVILAVTVDGHTMGEAYETLSPPTINVSVTGTVELQSVELYNSNRLVYSHTCVRDPEPVPNRVVVQWTGARVKSRARQSVWDGRLALERGRITRVAALCFEDTGLEDEITAVGDRAVTWRSVTSGDVDGLVLDLEAPSDAVATFTSEPTSFAFRLSDLEGGPIIVQAGGVGQEVRVSRAITGARSKQTSFEFVDADIRPGLNAYYVRVVQVDDGRAWSSPVFVDFG